MRVPVPDDLKAAVPEAVFRSWQVYFSKEPTVGERLDWWFSQLLAWCCSWGGAPPKPFDLVPWKWPKPPTDPHALADRIRAWAISHQTAGEGR